MKVRILLISILILFIVLFVGSCRKAGTWLVRDDHPEHGDALLVLMPIGFACFFTSIGFSARVIKEEKRWVKVFNQTSNLTLA